MEDVLLAVLPWALVRTAIPVVAAVVIAVLATGRARGLGVAGFAIMATVTLVGGVVGPLVPMMMRSRGVSMMSLLSNGLNVVLMLIEAVGLVLIVMAIVVGSRTRGLGASMPQQPQGPEFRNDR